MTTKPAVDKFTDPDALASALAGTLAAALAAALDARGAASLVVSGGRSPVALFRQLRGAALDWSRIWVTLADERWVDAGDAASNEHLVRSELLTGRAAAARFIGLKNAAATPADGAGTAWAALAVVARPFDAVLLGMGDDGHTASLFPNSPGLAAALDPDAPAACVAMTAPAAPAARLSLNLAALLDSRRIVILITGESKWRTYIAAGEAGPAADMPVRAVLRQRRAPVDVMWSP